jgi:hypothetical protein
VKVNLGDVGYYRVEYGSNSRATLTKALAPMTPIDRLNFIADSWALVQAGRAEPPSYLALIEAIGVDDHRAVWDQVVNSLTRLNRLALDRAERPALQGYARTRLRPLFDRLGWDGSGSGDDDDTLLRSSLIWALGELGDEDILAARPGVGSRASCRTRHRCRTRCAIPSPISSASAPARQATPRCWRSPAKARSRTSACAIITRLPARATRRLHAPRWR